MLVNTCASKDLVANWPRSLLHMYKQRRHAYIHTCICIGGGGTEQVFELISFISPAATTRRPLAPRFPCGPLIHGDRLHDIYTLPSDFIFGYRTRASVFRVYLVEMLRAFTCRQIHTMFTCDMCETNHDRDNLTPETEYYHTRARREGQLRFTVCWHAKHYIDVILC